MIDANALAGEMIQTAKATAGATWKEIQDVAKHEFQVLGQRIAAISTALISGEIKRSTAKILMRTVSSQIVAVLAMLSTLVLAAAQKIVRDALNAVKSAVNAAVGFALIAV